MKHRPPTPAAGTRIRGHDLGKPRLTAAGWLRVLLYLGVPAMLVGAGLDVLLQWLSGECIGLWCLLR